MYIYLEREHIFITHRINNRRADIIGESKIHWKMLYVSYYNIIVYRIRIL